LTVIDLPLFHGSWLLQKILQERLERTF